MVHQHFTLAENLTVLGTSCSASSAVAARLAPAGDEGAAVHRRAMRMACKSIPQAKVSTLSVGERQRVEILKALIPRLEEFWCGTSRRRFSRRRRRVAVRHPRAVHPVRSRVIFISHKLDEVLRVSHRVQVLSTDGPSAGQTATETKGRWPRRCRDAGAGGTVVGARRRPPITSPCSNSNTSRWRYHGHSACTIRPGATPGEIVAIAAWRQWSSHAAGCWAANSPPGTASCGVRQAVAWRRTPLIDAGIARIPKTVSRNGVIGELRPSDDNAAVNRLRVRRS